MKAPNPYTVDDGIRHAIDRVTRARDCEMAVYVDASGTVFVRMARAAPPPNARVECIVAAWDADTIQIRRTGASSEWVKR